jgi:hypothetical protein
VLPRQNRPSGVELPACAAGTRWHRYALTKADLGKLLTVESDAAGPATLRIDGEVRSRVPRGWAAAAYRMGNGDNRNDVGHRGGMCTCPDGSAWLVGSVDKWSCSQGLRCYGGASAGTCRSPDDPDLEAFYASPSAAYSPADYPYNDLAPYEAGSTSWEPRGQMGRWHYGTSHA